MEPVKMKTSAWVKKLQAQLKKATGDRTRDLREHKVAVERWKDEFAKWLRSNLLPKIVQIGVTELKVNVDRYDRGSPGFDTKKFFRGAPKPPVYPASFVEPIKRELRRLSIAQPETVHVTDADIKKFFGEDGEGDDE